jgi:hypothetical protein
VRLLGSKGRFMPIRGKEKGQTEKQRGMGEGEEERRCRRV